MKTTFSIHYNTSWGESLCLVLNDKKYPMQWSGDGLWTVSANASNTTSGSKAPAKSSSSTNKKGVSIPKTNDTTSNLPYVLIAVAFVGLVALVASKKKVNG